ncbi:LysE family translocator [Pseudomonas fluorescens]|uniref:Leucine efflux protein n=1 Tax=Pseudomonas fluorescens TaxID=294 RepID=A0A5E6WLB4_PSEFL|nr:LysE family translocator [Pseudomonas fluorescens]VVN29430.1 Leucine efflux protein [Pseudomonas fluorescens]
MLDMQTLLIFSAAVTLLLLSPGPNMAFVISHGVSMGWRGGLAAALGISLADLLLTALTASGVTALIAAWPPSFDIIRYCGAVYLLWMAFKLLQPRKAGMGEGRRETSLAAVLLAAMLNSLLNPKALLFFIVFLPQFVVPAKGAVAQQLLLGLVLSMIALVFHVLLGACGGVLSRRFCGKGRMARLQPRLLASVLALLALRLVLMQRPA